MKEHVDEMAKVLVDYTKKNHIMASHVILEDYAEQLYNAGYRKQSEGSSARGEWVYSEIYCTYICSECEECAPVDDFREPRLTNFCPNCGAKMKGENEHDTH